MSKKTGLTPEAERMLDELGEIVVEGRLITREQNRLAPSGRTRTQKPVTKADTSADKETTDE